MARALRKNERYVLVGQAIYGEEGGSAGEIKDLYVVERMTPAERQEGFTQGEQRLLDDAAYDIMMRLMGRHTCLPQEEEQKEEEDHGQRAEGEIP